MTAVVSSRFVCVCVQRVMCVCVSVGAHSCVCASLVSVVLVAVCGCGCGCLIARACACVRVHASARAFARLRARVFACRGLPVCLCGRVLIVVHCGTGWCCVLLCVGLRIPVSLFVFMAACMRVCGAAWRGVVWRGGGW